MSQFSQLSYPSLKLAISTRELSGYDGLIEQNFLQFYQIRANLPKLTLANRFHKLVNYFVQLRSDGDCIQTITLPAQSVWCSTCLDNGDFAVGSRYCNLGQSV